MADLTTHKFSSPFRHVLVFCAFGRPEPAKQPTIFKDTTPDRAERLDPQLRQSSPSAAAPVLTPLPSGAIERPPAAVAAARLNAESIRRERRLRRTLALVDALALAVALVVAVELASPDSLHPLGLLLFPALIAAAKIFGLYDSDRQRIRKTTAEELPKLTQLAALVVLAVWLGDRLLIGGPAGKDQAVAIGMVFVATALIGRWAARRVTARRTERERSLLVGDLDAYRRLAAVFKRHELSSELVGYAPIEQVLAGLRASPGNEATVLKELIAGERAHRIIIGPHTMTNVATFELIEAARSAGARVSLLPDMLEVVGSSVDFDDLYGLTLLGVRHSQLNRSSMLVKRGFDLVGASLLVILAAPLMAVIAAAIRLDSRGPILFRQLRVGRGGQPFQIIKFRTMVPGAEELKDGLRDLNEGSGLFKICDDPRMTRVGRTLRRASLDELPQLFNVLQGSMSLVGPRPLVADEDGRILGARRGRLRLTPGMTGPWQVSGSARIPLEDMVKLDHLYVSNWTLWSDVKILLRTVPFVFGSRGL